MERSDKNLMLKALIEKGSATGKLTTTEIDTVVIEADIDMEEMEKIYTKLDALGVEIIDDLSEESLDAISVDIDVPKDYDNMLGDPKSVIDDPVKVYLKDIGRVELLSSEEEIELAIRISNGDVQAKEKLTKANLRLVVSIVRKHENLSFSLKVCADCLRVMREGKEAKEEKVSLSDISDEEFLRLFKK